jgi:hypothetical protein
MFVNLKTEINIFLFFFLIENQPKFYFLRNDIEIGTDFFSMNRNRSRKIHQSSCPCCKSTWTFSTLTKTLIKTPTRNLYNEHYFITIEFCHSF